MRVYPVTDERRVALVGTGLVVCDHGTGPVVDADAADNATDTTGWKDEHLEWPVSSRQVRLASRLTILDKLDTLPDATIAEVAPLFDPWQPGLTVAVGEVYAWDGTLVEVIQAHTTQADWEPNLVPALFKIHRTDDGSGPIPWQPDISVVAGEQVTYEGVTYTVVQSHTTQAGWTPPATPSLFTPV